MTFVQIDPMQKPLSLTNELATTLRQEILNGTFKEGEKLPSSKKIEQQAGVSRSVVREAIAQLKAEGLLASKQGAGVFVLPRTNQQRFEIDKSDFESVSNAIQILELRMSVEIEMSAMAAIHRTDSQMANITFCMTQMEQKISAGEDAIIEDFALHRAIAEASGNPYFAKFIDYIGSGVIPAREIITKFEVDRSDDEFLQTIQLEHRQLVHAIQTQDAELARASAKAHLGNSIKRHRNVEQTLEALKHE